MIEQQDSNAPEWVRKHNLRHDAKQREENDRLRRQLENGKFVSENSSLYWEQFVKAVSANTQALKALRGENFDGTTSHSVPGGGGEQTCTIQVIQRGTLPQITRMNLFYKPGDNRIRCWHEDRDAGDIQLLRRADTVVAVPQEGIRMTADALAEHIVREMVGIVKRRSS